MFGHQEMHVLINHAFAVAKEIIGELDNLRWETHWNIRIGQLQKNRHFCLD